MTTRQVRRSSRRFAVHQPGPHGYLGDHTLDELFDAYPDTTWTIRADEQASAGWAGGRPGGAVIYIRRDDEVVAWAVERVRVA